MISWWSWMSFWDSLWSDIHILNTKHNVLCKSTLPQSKRAVEHDDHQKGITNTTSKWFIYCSSIDPDTHKHTHSVGCVSCVPVPNPHWLVICVSMECAILTCLCGVFTWKTIDRTHTHKRQKNYWQNNTRKNQFDFHTLSRTHTCSPFKSDQPKISAIYKMVFSMVISFPFDHYIDNLFRIHICMQTQP